MWTRSFQDRRLLARLHAFTRAAGSQMCHHCSYFWQACIPLAHLTYVLHFTSCLLRRCLGQGSGLGFDLLRTGMHAHAYFSAAEQLPGQSRPYGWSTLLLLLFRVEVSECGWSAGLLHNTRAQAVQCGCQPHAVHDHHQRCHGGCFGFDTTRGGAAAAVEATGGYGAVDSGIWLSIWPSQVFEMGDDHLKYLKCETTI